jgi:Carboxypeptidase regulatory-like domain
VTAVFSQLGAIVAGVSAGLPLAFGGQSLQPQTLSIVFETGSATPVSGARVSGSIQGNLRRIIYLSGIPGTVFTDGSFEFRNVVPGRHVIMTVDNPPATQALAASVVVGTGDLSGVEVSGTPVLPLNPRTPAMRIPSSTQTPGALPLATLRGRVLDIETGTPLKLGAVFVVGDSFARYELDAEGTFEFQRLLPGSYELEIQGVGYPTLRRSVVVEDQDVDLELKAG